MTNGCIKIHSKSTQPLCDEELVLERSVGWCEVVFFCKCVLAFFRSAEEKAQAVLKVSDGGWKTTRKRKRSYSYL